MSDIVEKKARNRPTIDSHLEAYNELITFLNTEIDKKSRAKEKGINVLRKTRKTLIKLQKQVPYISRHKPSKLNKRFISILRTQHVLTLTAFL